MGNSSGVLDRATQLWVRATGRAVRLDDHPWLDGPIGQPGEPGHGWLDGEIDRHRASRAPGGLIRSVQDLAGEGFDPALLQREVVDFYEHTTDYRLEVWSQWSPLMWPGGWLISTAFARRLQQLSLPLRPLDAAHGMDSEVLPYDDDSGRRLGAAWLRTLRSTGDTIYSGWYGIAHLPKATRPSIRVVFPLPNGSLTVFLQPNVDERGALVLRSPTGAFGDNGAYLIVATPSPATRVVRRIPIVEAFKVYLDDRGVLRTDHELRLWRQPVIRFHYKIEG